MKRQHSVRVNIFMCFYAMDSFRFWSVRYTHTVFWCAQHEHENSPKCEKLTETKIHIFMRDLFEFSKDVKLERSASKMFHFCNLFVLSVPLMVVPLCLIGSVFDVSFDVNINKQPEMCVSEVHATTNHNNALKTFHKMYFCVCGRGKERESRKVNE